MNDNQKPFSELCVISEEEKIYKGAIQWHIPESEISDYVKNYSTGKCIKSDWFSISYPSYCSFYISLHRDYELIKQQLSMPPILTYGYTESVCVSIIFYKKPPDCAWIKGKIHFDGVGEHKTFSVSAKDFDQKIEFKCLFYNPDLEAFLSSSAFGLIIHCSMKISMREVKCGFDKETVGYGESRDYGSSKETVKHDSFSDVKISIDDHLFQTHKTVLAQIPYFQEQFDANKSKQYFELTNIKPEIFNNILTFLYSRDIPHLDLQLAYELYIVASDLKICDMKCMCSSYLGANLTEINVCMVLKLSDVYEDIALKKECLKFIQRADIERLAKKAIIL